ncbi:LOW QUALITY PROTEIN: highly divergent homeobox [Microcaecilia unicolor]|uniref:LOW QUALITY PROTEIN: highly divergent homeobox n=1 Tax=Microcaecilia unicolor TaxID=1415580 RepID=A0A6P7YR42_9AMPH|nr:LOW QUALITY PROTEIN: highly divergent homeobox [Microcaecilia unicolor]
MNLRSVFTIEQQRILQRYYENGMTNQSKNCFQLILQCAQEAKLDFSVVRTWVGNKRRKMSSRSTLNSGTVSQGRLSNSPTMPPDGTIRNVPNIARFQSQQPPQTSSGHVVVSGVYSPTGSSSWQGSGKQSTTPMADVHKNCPRQVGKTEMELQQQQLASVQRHVPVSKNSSVPLGEKTVVLSWQLSPANSMYSKKNYGGSSVHTAEMIVPQKTVAWPRQYKTESSGVQRSHRPEHLSASLVSHAPGGQRGASVRNSSCGTQNLEIREVYSLAASDQKPRMMAGSAIQKPHAVDASSFSIAMETGDVDEYSREEELASMGAQVQNYLKYSENSGSPCVEGQSSVSPVPARTVSCNSQLVNARDLPDNLPYHNRDYRLSPSTSLHTTTGTLYSSANPSRSNFSPHFAASNQLRLSQNQNNYQISGNLTVPWITGCSRKRTLQDRTQFSDRDVAMLKKYWDKGMTSLGSVCREKIEAVAAELNVDCEIVRTWIGNRRRKYRLMGIEVPPPRGGPADFSDQLESSTSLLLTPGEETALDAGEDNDRNDEVSICLSEESSQEEISDVGRNEEIGLKEDNENVISTDNVKIEIIDDEESDLMSSSDVEQMRSLLDCKNEEVRLIERELEHQNQKYSELQSFTRNLILAVKSDDKEQQQMLLSNLPPQLEETDFERTSSEPDNTSYSLSSLSSEKNASDSL